MRIANREDLKKVCQAELEEIRSYKCRVLVCAGTGCIATGSQKIYEQFLELCRDMEGVSVEFQKDVPHLGVVKTGCQGICELGPLVRIEPAHFQYVKVQPEDCREIFEKSVLAGRDYWLCKKNSPRKVFMFSGKFKNEDQEVHQIIDQLKSSVKKYEQL